VTAIDEGIDAPIDAGIDAPVDANTPPIIGGSWQPLAKTLPIAPASALLLTDGTVMMHAAVDSAWWRLTPDANGDYVNGTWSQLASLPSPYAPLYFASAVLPDGRVLVEGGEYNGDAATAVETKLGAIYDPIADTWTAVLPPGGWPTIGDAPSVVFPNGTFMLGRATSAEEALFDATTLTWTLVGMNKQDPNAEEGYTLLPDGTVLAVDTTFVGGSETFDPSTGMWSDAGTIHVPLLQSNEIGPAMLMPDGSVIQLGATPNSAIRSPAGVWRQGPTAPQIAGEAVALRMTDGPAVLLPNGRLLFAASPGSYATPTHFLEGDGTKMQEVAATAQAALDSCFNVALLLLPTGQVLSVDQGGDAEIYTPTGTPDPAWAPTIANVATMIARGTTYTLTGTQLNGMSQAVAYGDDLQAATNYPLVRVTNDATSHVFYARTHDHSSMGVATGSAMVSTKLELPMSAETGASHLVVVANGIASAPVAITVQ
jgi:hypothetical protein